VDTEAGTEDTVEVDMEAGTEDTEEVDMEEAGTEGTEEVDMVVGTEAEILPTDPPTSPTMAVDGVPTTSMVTMSGVTCT